MKSDKKTIVLLLFMMACGVSSVPAEDTLCDDIHMRPAPGDGRICRGCRDQQDKSGDRELDRMELLNTTALRETDCRCELLEENENSEAHRPEKPDEQAEILEKLLLESIVSGADAPGR